MSQLIVYANIWPLLSLRLPRRCWAGWRSTKVHRPHSRKATELSWQAPARPRVCLIFWGFLVEVDQSDAKALKQYTIPNGFNLTIIFTCHLFIFIDVFSNFNKYSVVFAQKETWAHYIPKHKMGVYTHPLLSKILQTQLVYLLWLIKPDTRARVVLYFLSSFNKHWTWARSMI